MESEKGYAPKKEVDLGDFAAEEPDYAKILGNLIEGEPDKSGKVEADPKKTEPLRTEKDKTAESKKESLTPEKIKEFWNGLSHIEKNLVVSSNHVFESVMPRYRELKGQEKANVLGILRKLYLNKSPLVSLIEFPSKGYTSDPAGNR